MRTLLHGGGNQLRQKPPRVPRGYCPPGFGTGSLKQGEGRQEPPEFGEHVSWALSAGCQVGVWQRQAGRGLGILRSTFQITPLRNEGTNTAPRERAQLCLRFSCTAGPNVLWAPVPEGTNFLHWEALDL